MKRFRCLLALIALSLPTSRPLFAQTPDHTGQVPQPVPLGVLVREPSIIVLQVEDILPEKGLIVFKPVATLAGDPVPDRIRHHVGSALLIWARPGKRVVCFSRGGRAVTCVGNHWYYCWDFGEHAEPPVWSCADWVEGFAHSYVGSVDRLREHVTAILAGREVVVTAQAPEERLSSRRYADPIPRDWLRGQKGRVWRIKAGLQVTRPVRSEDSPSFVGWGVGGAEVLPALLRSLRSADPMARAEAVNDLGGLGPAARPALPALRQALRDADPFVRVYAVVTLAQVDPDTPPDLPVLLAALNAPDPALRLAAIGSLVALGPRARPAVPEIIRVLRQDRATDVLRGAAFALGKLAPGAPANAQPDADIPSALADALGRNSGEEVQYEMVRALLGCGARAWVAVPALSAVRGESQTNDPAAILAADLLARLDPPAVEILAEALRNPRCKVRAEIAARLGDLGYRARPAAPALWGALTDEEDWLRGPAARALLRIDPPRPLEVVVPVLADLTTALHAARETAWLRKDLRVRTDPARARIRLLRRDRAADEGGRVWREVRAGLTDVLSRSTSAEQARRVWDWRYGGFGDGAEEPIEEWREEVTDLADGVRELLGRLTPAADPIPVLAEAARDRNRYVRLAAAVALARVDPKHPAAVPTLVCLLEQHPALFWHLAGTLSDLGPDARAAVPWLRRALRDEDHSTYQAAADVLRRLDPQAPAQVWSACALHPVVARPVRSDTEGDALWAALAQEPVAAYRASWMLSSDGEGAVAFLRERLRPVRSADARELGRLIADLDSADFGSREKATRALAALREVAGPSLRRALAAPASAEARHRIEDLLERLEPTSGERLREARAVGALENLGTPAARQLLVALAEGAPQARLTQEATASLGRLTTRAAAAP